MALSYIAIRNAKPKDKPYKMGDTGGLLLLVQPSGGKLWRLKYRIDGKEKRLAPGRSSGRNSAGPQKQRNPGLACRCRVQWDDRFLVEPVVHSARKALAIKVFVQQHDISILMQMLRKILCNCPPISCYLTDL